MEFTHKKIEALEKAAKPHLAYRNGKSYYEFEGYELDRITHVLKEAQDEKSLDDWRKRIGLEKADLISKNAMARGSAVHEIAEAYLNNNCTCQYDNKVLPFGMFERMKPALDRISKIAGIEIPLVSELYGIAGTADIIAEFDNELCIIDLKTSIKKKEEKYQKKYYLQELFYAWAFEEMTKIPIKTLVTIIVSEEGDLQVIKQDCETWESELKRLIVQHRKKTVSVT